MGKHRLNRLNAPTNGAIVVSRENVNASDESAVMRIVDLKQSGPVGVYRNMMSKFTGWMRVESSNETQGNGGWMGVARLPGGIGGWSTTNGAYDGNDGAYGMQTNYFEDMEYVGEWVRVEWNWEVSVSQGILRGVEVSFSLEGHVAKGVRVYATTGRKSRSRRVADWRLIGETTTNVKTSVGFVTGEEGVYENMTCFVVIVNRTGGTGRCVINDLGAWVSPPNVEIYDSMADVLVVEIEGSPVYIDQVRDTRTRVVRFEEHKDVVLRLNEGMVEIHASSVDGATVHLPRVAMWDGTMRVRMQDCSGELSQRPVWVKTDGITMDMLSRDYGAYEFVAMAERGQPITWRLVTVANETEMGSAWPSLNVSVVRGYPTEGAIDVNGVEFVPPDVGGGGAPRVMGTGGEGVEIEGVIMKDGGMNVSVMSPIDPDVGIGVGSVVLTEDAVTDVAVMTTMHAGGIMIDGVLHRDRGVVCRRIEMEDESSPMEGIEFPIVPCVGVMTQVHDVVMSGGVYVEDDGHLGSGGGTGYSAGWHSMSKSQGDKFSTSHGSYSGEDGRYLGTASYFTEGQYAGSWLRVSFPAQMCVKAVCCDIGQEHYLWHGMKGFRIYGGMSKDSVDFSDWTLLHASEQTTTERYRRIEMENNDGWYSSYLIICNSTNSVSNPPNALGQWQITDLTFTGDVRKMILASNAAMTSKNLRPDLDEFAGSHSKSMLHVGNEFVKWTPTGIGAELLLTETDQTVFVSNENDLTCTVLLPENTRPTRIMIRDVHGNGHRHPLAVTTVVSDAQRNRILHDDVVQNMIVIDSDYGCLELMSSASGWHVLKTSATSHCMVNLDSGLLQTYSIGENDTAIFCDTASAPIAIDIGISTYIGRCVLINNYAGENVVTLTGQTIDGLGSFSLPAHHSLQIFKSADGWLSVRSFSPVENGVIATDRMRLNGNTSMSNVYQFPICVPKFSPYVQNVPGIMQGTLYIDQTPLELLGANGRSASYSFQAFPSDRTNNTKTGDASFDAVTKLSTTPSYFSNDSSTMYWVRVSFPAAFYPLTLEMFLDPDSYETTNVSNIDIYALNSDMAQSERTSTSLSDWTMLVAWTANPSYRLFHHRISLNTTPDAYHTYLICIKSVFTTLGTGTTGVAFFRIMFMGRIQTFDLSNDNINRAMVLHDTSIPPKFMDFTTNALDIAHSCTSRVLVKTNWSVNYFVDTKTCKVLVFMESNASLTFWVPSDFFFLEHLKHKTITIDAHGQLTGNSSITFKSINGLYFQSDEPILAKTFKNLPHAQFTITVSDLAVRLSVNYTNNPTSSIFTQSGAISPNFPSALQNCDTTDGPILLTLPAPEMNTGDLIIRDSGGHAHVNGITVPGPFSNGTLASIVISRAYASVKLFSDGVQWHLLSDTNEYSQNITADEISASSLQTNVVETNTVVESTEGNGVNIEGIALKNGLLSAATVVASTAVQIDNNGNQSGTTPVVFPRAPCTAETTFMTDIQMYGNVIVTDSESATGGSGYQPGWQCLSKSYGSNAFATPFSQYDPLLGDYLGTTSYFSDDSYRGAWIKVQFPTTSTLKAIYHETGTLDYLYHGMNNFRIYGGVVAASNDISDWTLLYSSIFVGLERHNKIDLSGNANAFDTYLIICNQTNSSYVHPHADGQWRLSELVFVGHLNRVVLLPRTLTPSRDRPSTSEFVGSFSRGMTQYGDNCVRWTPEAATSSAILMLTEYDTDVFVNNTNNVILPTVHLPAFKVPTHIRIQDVFGNAQLHNIVVTSALLTKTNARILHRGQQLDSVNISANFGALELFSSTNGWFVMDSSTYAASIVTVTSNAYQLKAQDDVLICKHGLSITTLSLYNAEIGRIVTIKNDSVKDVVVTGQTIDGQAQITIQPKQTAQLLHDATNNWLSIGEQTKGDAMAVLTAGNHALTSAAIVSTYLCDTSTGQINITVPEPTAFFGTLVFKDVSEHAHINRVQFNIAESNHLFDGLRSILLLTFPGGVLTLHSDRTRWVTLSGHNQYSKDAKFNSITESFPDTGVTIDSVVLKDGNVTANSIEATTAIKTNTIQERTNDSGVSIDSVTLKDGDISANMVTANDILKTDSIEENTPGQGVTIEAITVKGGDVTAGTFEATVKIKTNAIQEYNDGNGVTIDSVVLKDGNINAGTVEATASVNTDSIQEKTANNGVSIESVLIKDGNLTAGDVEATASVKTNTIAEKTANAGVTIDNTVLKDGALTASDTSYSDVPIMFPQFPAVGITTQLKDRHMFGAMVINDSDESFPTPVGYSPGWKAMNRVYRDEKFSTTQNTYHAATGIRARSISYFSQNTYLGAWLRVKFPNPSILKQIHYDSGEEGASYEFNKMKTFRLYGGNVSSSIDENDWTMLVESTTTKVERFDTIDLANNTQAFTTYLIICDSTHSTSADIARGAVGQWVISELYFFGLVRNATFAPAMSVIARSRALGYGFTDSYTTAMQEYGSACIQWTPLPTASRNMLLTEYDKNVIIKNTNDIANCTIYLPKITVPTRILIKDVAGNMTTRPMTVQSILITKTNNQILNNEIASDTWTINDNYGFVELYSSTSGWHVINASARPQSSVTVSANYTVAQVEHIILCDTSTANLTITLTASVNGRGLAIKNYLGSNQVTVSGQTIDGLSQITLSAGKTVHLLNSNGTWQSLNDFATTSGSGSGPANFTSVTSTYSVTATDSVIACNPSSASFVVTLPATATAGRSLTFQMSSSTSGIRTVTLQCAANTYIEHFPNATMLITTPLKVVTFIGDGTNWRIVSELGRNIASTVFTGTASYNMSMGIVSVLQVSIVPSMAIRTLKFFAQVSISSAYHYTIWAERTIDNVNWVKVASATPDGNRTTGHARGFSANDINAIVTIPMLFYDNPNTTQQVSYRIGALLNNITIFINRTANNVNNSSGDGGRVISSLHVEEVF